MDLQPSPNQCSFCESDTNVRILTYASQIQGLKKAKHIFRGVTCSGVSPTLNDASGLARSRYSG
jgi:hypothetical protein